MAVLLEHRADSALVEARIAQGMVEAAAARDPGNGELAVDVAQARSTLGFVLAAAGRHEEAGRALRTTAAAFERWGRADSTDERLVSTWPEVDLGFALLGRDAAARDAHGAARAGAWRTARAAYLRARAASARALALAGRWSRSDAMDTWIADGLAECDSALAAVAPASPPSGPPRALALTARPRRP